MDDDVDIVVVHTDIDEPKSTAFDKVHALNATKSGANPNQEADDDPFLGLDLNQIQTTTTEVAELATLKRISASKFSAGSAGTLTFTDDDTTTTIKDESARISGAYDGAMGVYECTGTEDCTVNLMPRVKSPDIRWMDVLPCGWR